MSRTRSTPTDEAAKKQLRIESVATEKLASKGAVPLQDLVEDLSRNGNYSTDSVTRALMSLQSRKRIVISETTPYASFGEYATSPMSLWFWEAVGATLISVVLLLVTSGPALYLRYAFGVVLVLFLPGYSLIEALYPERELEELTRFALSIGLSLALVPLAGLALNYTPFGLRLVPVAFSISCVTFAFLVFALRRKYSHYGASED